MSRTVSLPRFRRRLSRGAVARAAPRLRPLGRRRMQGRRVALPGQDDGADLPGRQARRGRVQGTARMHEVPGARQLRRLRRRRRRRRAWARATTSTRAPSTRSARSSARAGSSSGTSSAAARRGCALLGHQVSCDTTRRREERSVQGAGRVRVRRRIRRRCRLPRRKVRALPLLPRTGGLLHEGRRAGLRRRRSRSSWTSAGSPAWSCARSTERASSSARAAAS